ncbi:sugar porter family MFS transporter [Phaeodactylibacter xiamenensis]|uniref:sugar porter family MFS transporter n=1 Tax=Phaeodactylibacter xiamenensis TaxID=1524460 RepID=UPI0024A9085F|nr:sugar porter family MFS transporter [Phaeodactylibacter xiamenensis]
MMMQNKTSSGQMTRLALIISLGGFLFGFDASVISGAIRFLVPEFGLSDLALGWVVASLTFTSTLAMMVAGPLSDRIGRKKLLLIIAFMYAFSALFSAIAPTYGILVAARMLGGLAVGASLIIAPMYIAELSPPEKRGRMVSINQLNIVIGFSAAYFSNYFLLQASGSGAEWVQSMGIDTNTWRWMLGVELLPALAYFGTLFAVPESPRWLVMQGREEEAAVVIGQLSGEAEATVQIQAIKESVQAKDAGDSLGQKLRRLFRPTLRKVLWVAAIVGILQQLTGVNAIFFYAPFIFEQSGIGSDAAFSQAIYVGLLNVVFTLIAMSLIDRIGRKPLLLVGLLGIALSMGLVSYGFQQATYELTTAAVAGLPESIDRSLLAQVTDVAYEDDLAFKTALKAALGRTVYVANEAVILQSAANINPTLILTGILGFVAFFAVSLGPVMWVLFSELFPNYIRAVAVSFVGFINSVVSFSVQQFFPWELANLGNALTFGLFGGFAAIGFLLVWRLLPETKSRSLEELEKELITDD